MEHTQLDLQAFKNKQIVNQLAEEIKLISNNMPGVKIMHICGSHENAIARYGLRQFLPTHIEVIAGPGCPVCICPVEIIDQAIHLARQNNTTVLTFGDMLRVPATNSSLEKARRDGGSVKIIYSPLDAVKLANKNPAETFVFFAIGFETTAAGIAGLIASGTPKNLFFLIAHRYIPPALARLMSAHQHRLKGFLLAGHATAITGLQAYDFVRDNYQLPCVAAGFEPVDILLAIRELLKQIKNKQHEIINCYSRVINDQGNPIARKYLKAVFELTSGNWRGIDCIEDSAYQLKKEYAFIDATKQLNYKPAYSPQSHHPSCLCHQVMLGEVKPGACKLFAKACTPNSPFGPCMVSREGTCNVSFNYRSL